VSSHWSPGHVLDGAQYRAFLFDLDGTLYDQPQLRRRMAVELLRWILANPFRWREVKILSAFRKLREGRRSERKCALEAAQYRWTAEHLGMDQADVRRVVGEWIFSRPLKHLDACRPPGLKELFCRLQQQGIKIGVFSDYPVAEKLAALGLSADVCACATDAAIDCFKPDPAGLKSLCAMLKVEPSECVHMGDRKEIDELCARACGCESIILPAHHAKKIGREKTYDLMFGK
jgi:FMN phosphatase YigB (HAD superfamily)